MNRCNKIIDNKFPLEKKEKGGYKEFLFLFPSTKDAFDVIPSRSL
jgi:hypothetical protein